MTLLDTLTAAPRGSTNLSLLATKEYRTQVAPKPSVGMRVHVYGPQGVAYYRARVFDVSGRGIRVVGEKKDELLSPEDWKTRVREENPFDYMFVPAFLRPAEPPALPPEIQRAEKQKHTLRDLAILSAQGAARRRAPGSSRARPWATSTAGSWAARSEWWRAGPQRRRKGPAEAKSDLRRRVDALLVEEGWVVPATSWTMTWFDEEFDRDATMRFDSLAEAMREAEGRDLEIQASMDWGPTDRLRARWKRYFSGVLSSDLSWDYALLSLLDDAVIAGTLDLDGAWWNEALDPDIYSAPRGVIFPGRVDAWTWRYAGGGEGKDDQWENA